MPVTTVWVDQGPVAAAASLAYEHTAAAAARGPRGIIDCQADGRSETEELRFP